MASYTLARRMALVVVLLAGCNRPSEEFIADLASAQTNRIDFIRPDAPELAALGTYDIGVRTMVVIDSGRPDVVTALAPGFDTLAGEPVPMYDRPLTVEVWYPADLPPAMVPRTQYIATTGDPAVVDTLTGRAVRDAIVACPP